MGAPEVLPPETVAVLKQAEEDTRDRPGATVNLAVGYGGRREIADAVRSLLAEHAARGTSLEELVDSLEVEHIAEHLYTRGQPDPDLVIRTSGEQRMSGFLLWQTANAEFHFTDVYWPDFRRVDFLRALRDYSARHRRFGELSHAGSGADERLRNSSWQPSLATSPSSTCGWGCASTGWSPASSTPTPATRASGREVENEPRADPAALRDQARDLLRELDSAGLPADRTDFLRGS